MTEERWDPVARDSHGAPLSAGELCTNCWHRWIDHDHLVELGSPEFGWCRIPVGGFCCSCHGFVSGDVPYVAPTSFAAPFPEAPPLGRHASPEPEESAP